MATLYLHIPFCKRICSYCDFYKVGAIELLPRVVDMLHSEMETRADYILSRELSSIYFGGGTPSLVALEDIESLIAHARELFDCSAVGEITIEANPDDITEEYAVRLARTSVNRVSLGVQSFDDEVLHFMNRRHLADDAVEAVRRLRGAGVNNISIDLIFGVSGFGEDSLRRSVERAIALDVEHISAYHLTVEERTKLGLMVGRGEYRVVDEEQSEADYLLVHRMLEAAGYEHYEVSNYAKVGRRAQHNASYWRGVEYLGLGPGAHSFSGDNRTWCVSSAREYAEGKFRYESEVLTTIDHLNEYVMTSLRTVEGVDLALVRERFGEDAAERIVRIAEGWARRGVLRREGDAISIPAESMLLSDAIIESMFEV